MAEERRTAISLEGKFGIGLALLGLFGAGVVIVRPDLHALGWLLITVSVIGAVLLAIFHVVELWQTGRRSKMFAFVGALLSAVSLVAFGAWYFWPEDAARQRKPSVSVVSASHPKVSTVPASVSLKPRHSTSDATADESDLGTRNINQEQTAPPPLLVRCDSVARPTIGRVDAPTMVVQIIGPPTTGGFPGAGNTTTPAGGEALNWGDDFPMMWIACRAYNLGERPLVNLRLGFKIEWRLVVPTEHGTESGPVVSTTERFNSSAMNLLPGKDNSDIIYIASRSPTYVQVTVLDTATYDDVDSGSVGSYIATKVVGNAALGPENLMVLWPFVRTEAKSN